MAGRQAGASLHFSTKRSPFLFVEPFIRLLLPYNEVFTRNLGCKRILFYRLHAYSVKETMVYIYIYSMLYNTCRIYVESSFQISALSLPRNRTGTFWC